MRPTLGLLVLTVGLGSVVGMGHVTSRKRLRRLWPAHAAFAIGSLVAFTVMLLQQGGTRLLVLAYVAVLVTGLLGVVVAGAVRGDQSVPTGLIAAHAAAAVGAAGLFIFAVV